MAQAPSLSGAPVALYSLNPAFVIYYPAFLQGKSKETLP